MQPPIAKRMVRVPGADLPQGEGLDNISWAWLANGGFWHMLAGSL
jgi:hypothetical protein